MKPRVSLIIPTHNRRAAILRALTAVTQQTFPLDQLEAIVVADGCVDDTVAVLNQQALPFRLVVLQQPGLGPAAARNAAAKVANGRFLIFIDDDIVIVHGFVQAHLAAHGSSSDRVVMGHLPPAPLARAGYYEQGLQQWWRQKFSQMRQPGYRFGYDDLFSGNFSVSAALFARVGGFEEALRCHEDYELGLRLIAAGARFAYADEATGVHHDQTNSGRSMLRRLAEGSADMFLLRRYPELRLALPLARSEWTFLERAMRWSAFRLPAVGDAIAHLQQACLKPLEALWLRRLWWLLFAHLHDYWYWRGVAAAEPDPAAVAAYFADGQERPLPIPELTLDLADGLDAAEAVLDAHRPAALRLVHGDCWLGDIPAAPGRERLHGGHLRRLLANQAPFQLLLIQADLPGALPPIPAEPPTVPQEPYPPEDWFQPKKIAELDVTRPAAAQDLGGCAGLHALVRVQEQMVGTVTLPVINEPAASATCLAEAVQTQLGNALLAKGWSRPAVAPPLPPVSVVVCSRDRPDKLATCLAALHKLDYPQFEIVVVDNAPATNATAQLVAGSEARYVREDRPGLNWARNRGLAAAAHDLVAFTDDDACPDRGWLRAVAAAFMEEEVTAVTGSVLPQSLDTVAQNLFEFGYGGMNHGFERRVKRRAQLTTQQLLWASGYGVGANMALRRSHLAGIGDFDVALDVGTPSGGGGDVEMFHRVVAFGGTLVYEPDALVWHQHRPGANDLLKLVQNNGRSFGCYLLTCARNRTVGRWAIARFALYHWLWRWLVLRLRRPNGFPRQLIWAELLAAFSSPWHYVRAQRQAKRTARLAAPANADAGQPLTLGGES